MFPVFIKQLRAAIESAPIHGVDEYQLVLVHNGVSKFYFYPIHGLGLPNILHIVVGDGGGQDGGKSNGGGQLPDDRHTGAGQGEGGEEIYHQHEAGGDRSDTSKRRGEAAERPCAPGTLPGTLHAGPQFFGRPGQFVDQGLIFCGSIFHLASSF